MKKLTLSLLLTTFALVSFGQIKFKGDTIQYKLTMESELVFKQAVRSAPYVQLISWKDGFWFAEIDVMPERSYNKVYISDEHFEKNMRYRKKLEKFSVKAKKENVLLLQSLRKKYGKQFGDGIYDEQAVIGMTSSILRLAIGEPKKINTTTTASSVSQQWIYYETFGRETTDPEYYYVVNNRLVTIQN